jgi:hypothetical protein
LRLSPSLLGWENEKKSDFSSRRDLDVRLALRAARQAARCAMAGAERAPPIGIAADRTRIGEVVQIMIFSLSTVYAEHVLTSDNFVAEHTDESKANVKVRA